MGGWYYDTGIAHTWYEDNAYPITDEKRRSETLSAVVWCQRTSRMY